MHMSHVSNTLGALALSLNELIISGVTATTGTSASGAAALAVLSQTSPLGVTELGRHVGLSQPAAARMIDSLEHRNLVRRQRGPGRQTTVVLTPTGEQSALAALSERAVRLTPLLARLDDAEQRTLAELLDRLLDEIYTQVGDPDLVCRLCDRPGCIDADQTCPVGAAHRARQESHRHA